jgi:hypothetical protein
MPTTVRRAVLSGIASVGLTAVALADKPVVPTPASPSPAVASPAATTPAAGAPVNLLTEQEVRDGWVLLFDGKSTAGWRLLGGGAVPADVWTVREGVLVHLPVKGGGKDIIYDRPVENFELNWEWRVPKPNGNSGVKYRVQETQGKSGAFGPEYQMMADGDKADKDATASLYDVLPPTDKHLLPPGEFNVSRIVVRGDKVEHWLNGRRTVAFEFWTEAFNQAVAKSKFKGSPVWGRNSKGYIALTDHSDEAHFRSIKLRELK